MSETPIAEVGGAAVEPLLSDMRGIGDAGIAENFEQRAA